MLLTCILFLVPITTENPTPYNNYIQLLVLVKTENMNVYFQPPSPAHEYANPQY